MDSIVPLFAPHQRQRLLEYYNARTAGQSAPDRYRYQAFRRDETLVSLEIFVQKLDWNGQPAVQNTIMDVVDASAQEAELFRHAEDSHQRLISAIESSSEGYALWGPDERLILCNERFKTIYPELREHLIAGAGFEALLRIRLEVGAIQEAVGREDAWLAERLQRFRAPGGAFDLLQDNGDWAQIRDRRLSDGTVLLTVVDITERKQAEQELADYKTHLEDLVDRRTGEVEQQKRQLEAALTKERELSGLQRQFVAMVSHEFRTPLAVIDGMAQRILRRLDRLRPDHLAETMTRVRASVSRLVELMESVLSAAQMEEGKIAFEPGDCPLPSLLNDIAASYAEINPGHTIITEIDDLPEIIAADPKLLRQVFSNLISNAIKYSPDATIVTVKGACCENGDIRVSVADQGVGVPEQELAKLFQRFFRASNSTGIAGSGIGLHLVRHLIDMHGGTIAVDSKVGEGTVFHIRLPTCQPVDRRREHARTSGA